MLIVPAWGPSPHMTNNWRVLKTIPSLMRTGEEVAIITSCFGDRERARSGVGAAAHGMSIKRNTIMGYQSVDNA